MLPINFYLIPQWFFFPFKFKKEEVTWWGRLEIKLSEGVLLTTKTICLLKGAANGQSLLKGWVGFSGVTWTRRRIKAVAYWAPNWPRSQTRLLPSRAAVLCSNTFCGLLPRYQIFLSTIPNICLHSMVIRFNFFLSPYPTLHFHFGGERGYEKSSSIMAEVLMVLEIELWTVDPHPPKMRPPSRILGCP